MPVGNCVENDNIKMSITCFYFILSATILYRLSKRSFSLFIFLEHLITWADLPNYLYNKSCWPLTFTVQTRVPSKPHFKYKENSY